MHHRHCVSLAFIAGIMGCASTTPQADTAPDVPSTFPMTEQVPASESQPPVGSTSDGPTPGHTTDSSGDPDNIERLEVAIVGKSGSVLAGKAELTEVSDGVQVVVRVERAKVGLHGVHIHEVADCSAPDASSAGDHFNPENLPHALPAHSERHLGDLGNLMVKEPEDRGRLEIVVKGANLDAGSPHSFLNRALVVHEDHDDGSQPSGNSGARVGCAELTREAARTQAIGEVKTGAR